VDDFTIDGGAERSRKTVVTLEGCFRAELFNRRNGCALVVAPGRTSARTASCTLRRAMPEMRIFSISAADLIWMAIKTVRSEQ